jgi:hypothetical protein
VNLLLDAVSAVELSGTEIDLEGSEPDTTLMILIIGRLDLWAEACCWAEQPPNKLEAIS